MTHPFCLAGSATNHEEYKQVIKRRMIMFASLFFVGILTIAVLQVNTLILKNPGDSHVHGFFAGAGAGLIFAGGLLWIKNKRLFTNDALLKEARIKDTDERNGEIRNAATRVSAFVLLISSYLICLIGGLILPEYFPLLAKVLLIQAGVFLVSYFIAFGFFNKSM